MTEQEPHLIRKYANRKLYDTKTRHYVSLSGIWELVCAGIEVQVVEHETGNDITAVVLSQIVASHEKQTAIERTPEAERAAEQRRDSLLDYLRRTLGRPAAAMGDEIAAALQDGLNRGGVLAAEVSDDLGRRGTELAQELGRRTADWGRRRSEMEEAVEAAVNRALEGLSFSSRRDLSQLRRRVDELEKRVAKVQAALQVELDQQETPSGRGAE